MTDHLREACRNIAIDTGLIDPQRFGNGDILAQIKRIQENEIIPMPRRYDITGANVAGFFACFIAYAGGLEWREISQYISTPELGQLFSDENAEAIPLVVAGILNDTGSKEETEKILRAMVYEEDDMSLVITAMSKNYKVNMDHFLESGQVSMDEVKDLAANCLGLFTHITHGEYDQYIKDYFQAANLVQDDNPTMLLTLLLAAMFKIINQTGLKIEDEVMQKFTVVHREDVEVNFLSDDAMKFMDNLEEGLKKDE